MKVKMSATFVGKCDLCRKRGDVVSFGDEESKKVVTVCRNCADGMPGIMPEELIAKHGKVDEEPFKQGVKIEGKMVAG